MTGPTSSSSSSAGSILGGLETVRDAAQGLAAGSLQLVEHADRAIQAVNWAVETGLVTDFPATYQNQLDAAYTQLIDAGTGVPSALSTLQLIVSGSMSGAVGAALEIPGPVLIMAPTFERESAQGDLDEYLTTLWGDDSLATRRRDAWPTLHRGTEESAAQACHTLREILTSLLDRFASNDHVKAAPWWEADSQTRDGVSKRHKVKYLVICDGDADLSEELLDELGVQVDHAHATHGLTIKMAHHQSDAISATAQAVLADLEEVMLTLLRLRRSFGLC